MVFQKVELVELELTTAISETERNVGGFGHTGVK
jgi:dUTPase